MLKAPGATRHGCRNELDHKRRVGIPIDKDCLTYSIDLKVELFAQFAHGGVEQRLSSLQFPSGKLPEPAVSLRLRPLADQELSVLLDNGRENSDFGHPAKV